MSKVSIEIKDVDFSRLTVKESNNNPNIFAMNYKYDDGTVKGLLVKTPFIDCNFSGLFFSTDKDGKAIDDKDRMQWRAYIEDEVMIGKLNELQESLEANKAAFVGPVNIKDKKQKEFDVQNIIGEYTDKNNVTHQYARFKFRTKKDSPDTLDTAFFNIKGEHMNIAKLKDFESKLRPREFRYRLIFSMYGWKMKSTHLYGVTFSIEQMQIEITSAGSTNIKELLKNVSLFDETTTATIENVDLSKHIEAEADADDDEVVEEKNITQEQPEEEDDEQDEEDEEEEEIKPAKKSSSVKVTATKTVRKKASSNA